MSKKSNNIPLSKLAERAFALCPGSLERKRNGILSFVMSRLLCSA